MCYGELPSYYFSPNSQLLLITFHNSICLDPLRKHGVANHILSTLRMQIRVQLQFAIQMGFVVQQFGQSEEIC